MRNLWEDFLDIPALLSVMFWALWFGMGVLVGVAAS